MSGADGGAILSDVHRAYLNSHAVSDEVIEAQGIRSDGDDIVFTWREGDQVTEQRRPWPGPSGQYFWTAGADLHLNVIRDPGPDAPVLLCEGTKQSLAVASWAPPEYAVYGMPGCYGWTMSRHLDLSRFAGRDVLVMLDADAASNLDVWDAGMKLAAELDMEDPSATARFIPSPAWGKDGIDDYLSRIAEGRRADRLVRLIGRAQDKPADKKPTKRKLPDQVPDSGGLPVVIINAQRREVIHQVLGALRQRWDGTELFGYGGALTRLRGTRTEPLSRGAFLRWLPEGVACYRYTPPGVMTPGKYEDAWPDRETIDALMASADEFSPLDRIARTPFLRPDGTVCAKNGYDPGTKTMLITGNSGMDRLDVSESPSREDAIAAAAFLSDDWLGSRGSQDGMPFRDQASRANALALALTPFIRGLVPLVPMAVISGLQMGVGKNLLADCIAILNTGEVLNPLTWISDDNDEVRKQILAAFRSGQSLFCFDEAHEIGGTALSRALTSATYSDRLLGESTVLSFPNNVTWMSLGNQVQVRADMARRYYLSELYPQAPNPQDRPDTDFRHPDLRGWTRDSRPELVTAALTLIRAWFTAGRPAAPSRGTVMGSFEAWDAMMSGILHFADVPGFLGNLIEKRAERDSHGGLWEEHLAWLDEAFGTGRVFQTRDVRSRAIASAGTWSAPPDMASAAHDDYTQKLGTMYAHVTDRWFGPLRLVKAGTGHGGGAKWVVERQDRTVTTVTTVTKSGDCGDSGDSPTLFAPTRDPAHDVPAHMRAITRRGEEGECLTTGTTVTSTSHPVLAFDLETASADELFTYRPRDETGYVRLAGAIGPGGQPVITSASELIPLLDLTPEVTGHNILGFDLLALAWHHGADYDRLAVKARDTEIIERQANPPRSRESGTSRDAYGLDAVAGRLGVAGKTADLGDLKRRHGGYDAIPLDDPEYRAYLEGDLRATAAVSAAMRERYPEDPYVAREHRLAALAGRMTLNGFLVDEKLLSDRLRAGEDHKREALRALHDGFGLPLERTVLRGRGKGKHEVTEEVTSPLATDAGRAWLQGFWDEHGVTDPPRTAKAGKLSIGADDLKAVALARPDLASFCEAMGIVTGTRTVYQTASDCLAPDGRVHPLNSFRQASGRWSVTNPGLTVFGKRGGRHVERDVFVPDPGHVLLSFDLSQVDMRALAWLSGDHAYRALFAPGEDAHAAIAAQVGISRQDAKVIGHGWNYGLGAARMKREGLDPGKVDAFTAGMSERFPVLIAWREQVRARGKAGEVLDNGFGRRMACDPARAYTVAPALMGQGGARDIMAECLLRLDSSLWPLLRVMVHDEILLSSPEADAADVAAEVKRAMTWQLDEDLWVLCDMAAGRTWGECSAH